MDIIVITTMAIVGTIFILPLLKPSEGIMLIAVLIFVLGAIIAALVLVSSSSILNKTVDKSMSLAMKVSKKGFIKRLSSTLTGFVEKFRFGMKSILRAKGSASACILLTVIIWINEALRLFIILLALPDLSGVSLGAVFIASSIANIIGIVLPLGSGNILGIEAVFIAVGMDYTDAITASFLHVATSIWISVPLGVTAMLITGFKVNNLNDKV